MIQETVITVADIIIKITNFTILNRNLRFQHELTILNTLHTFHIFIQCKMVLTIQTNFGLTVANRTIFRGTLRIIILNFAAIILVHQNSALTGQTLVFIAPGTVFEFAFITDIIN